MPVELVLGDGFLVDAEVVGEVGPEFFLFEGGAGVLVVGEEDGLEVLVDQLLYVELCHVDML